jgi:four helix bundle suffix protein
MLDKKYHVLKRQKPWRDAYYYQKADTLYQMTFVFCQRFLPAHGDRTTDQMVQAARSGKQNIVEGSEDGQTSSEMEIKLMNVARGSLQELRADYLDYLNTHHLSMWDADNVRQQKLREFCHSHNDYSDYEPLLVKMNDEEMANLALTLCHQTDKMMCAYIEKLEKQFVTEGGIKERMYAARTGYRQERDAHMRALEAENTALKKRIKELEEEIKRIRKT